jgi:predicted transcriptional regulator
MTLHPDSAGENLEERLRWSADIVAAYVAQNTVAVNALPDLLRSVYQTLGNLGGALPVQPSQKQKPAVPISKSVHEDYIVCLEDGKQLKMLKRYLRSRYDMSPEDYRRKWGLPPDYPMVAPAYAARRSDFAKKIGLGRGVRRRRDRVA